MSKNRFLTIAVILLVMLNIGAIGFFRFNQKPPMPPPMKGPKQIIIDRLHFDAQQVEEYEKLVSGHHQNIMAIERELQETKHAYFGLLQGNDFSEKDSLAAAIGQLQQQIESVHFEHFEAIKRLCKDEQLNDFEALASELARFFIPHRPPRKK